MAEHRLGTGESLSPDLIAQRAFTTNRKGFDPAEVKSFLASVANTVRDLREQLRVCEAARKDAEQRALHPKIDEEMLLSAVGEETATILRTARTAAGDIRAKAEDQAAALLRDAQSRVESITAEAEAAAAQLAADAQESATALRVKVDEEADRIRESARQEAETVRQAAEQERKITIEAAQQIREQILSDLNRRRRVANTQIEQLRAGRERLLEAYFVVRRTLDEVTDELQRADGEARHAADEVAKRAAARPADDLLLDLTPGPSAPVSAVDEAAPSPVGEQEPADQAPDAQAPDDQGPIDQGPGSQGPGDQGPVDQGPVDAGGGPAQPSGQDALARMSPPPGRLAEPAPQSPAEGLRGVQVMDVLEVLDAVESVRLVPAGAPAEVDSLFARIRADRADALVKARSVLDDDPPPVVLEDQETSPVQAGEPVQASEETTSDEDEALLQRRDEATADLEVTLARRLKRALQDEQNDLLDRLRQGRGTPKAATLLAKPAERRARYTSAARVTLQEAAQAGMAFVADLGYPAGEAVPAPDVDDLAVALAAAVADPLLRRLQQAFAESAGDDQQVLIEALGAVYRECKTQRIEQLAGDQVTAAFARGTYEVVPAGSRLRWVAEDIGGPCPDCDDNVLAGGLIKGDEYPTGQTYPPAHSGCRCLLVPFED